MMLHGEVVSLTRYTGYVALTVKDVRFGDIVPLRVKEHDAHTGEAVTITLGDAIVWEGNTVYWSNTRVRTVALGLACAQAREVRLPRVGYLR